MKNKLIGHVDVKLPKWGVIIRHISHYESNGKRWFNFPSFSTDLGNGKYKFTPFFQWELDAHNGQFMEKLSAAVKDYCEKNQIKEPPALNFEKSEEFTDDCPF